MVQLQTLDDQMARSGSLEFDPNSLAASVSKKLIHDACVMYHSNRRVGTAKTKTRAEVQGASKKLYRQKGTGRARAGNRRTPVRVGGGHAFAKRPRDWSYSMPRKARQAATRMSLRLKMEAGEVFVFNRFELPEAKTRYVVKALKSAGLAAGSCLIVTEAENHSLVRAARNIPGVTVLPRRQLNADAVMRHRNVVIQSEAIQALPKVAIGGTTE